MTPFYGDISGKKQWLGNGYVDEAMRSVWYYWDPKLRPTYPASWGGNDWSQGYLAWVTPGLKVHPGPEPPAEWTEEALAAQQYGLYFDSSKVLLDNVMSSTFIDPALSEYMAAKKLQLMRPLGNFYDGFDSYLGASAETELDGSSFFEVFITYDSGWGCPEYIEFYQGEPSGPTFFWKNNTRCIEIAG